MKSSAKISVLLLEDVASLGKAGDIVEVAEGYARNALFPDGKAALASETVQEEHKKSEEKKQQKLAQELARLQKQAEELEGTEIVMYARRKEDTGDEIFGSISVRDIQSKLTEQTGTNISPKAIDLAQPITSLGTYHAIVRLSKEVDFTVTITVVPETP